MENPAKKELIAEIAERLEAHEETYEAGAWEAFSERQNNRGLVWIQWLSIAAVFFIVVSLLPFHLKDLVKKEGTENIAAVGNKSRRERTTKYLDLVKIDTIVKKAQSLFVQELPTVKGKQITNTERNVVNSVPSENPVQTSVVTDTPPVVIAAVKDKVPAAIVKADQPKDIMDFLRQESKIASVAVKKKSTSNWDFGVELLPTATKANINLGAGLTTEYKLSKSFSVSSGIAFIQLDAGKLAESAQNTMNSPAPASMNAGASKRLISTDANISAIDIPISLTYNLNSHLYTSIGVSYFNVLSEKRSNNYLTELPVSRTMQDPVTGQSLVTYATLSGENTEPAASLPLKGNSYIGFFNFSIGRKQEVFKKYNIVLEPFIKIPVGQLSHEDLKLTNGGMKLKFSF